jgi:hypothetical protein
MDARGRALSAREEELLGLLAGFPDGEGGSDRELSFSDFVEAGARPGAHRHLTDYHGSTPSLRRQDAASKQEQQKAAVPERRRRSGGSRGSCGGSGDGVLLNFYVPPRATAHQERDRGAVRARAAAAESCCCRQGKVSGKPTDTLLHGLLASFLGFHSY